MKDLMKRGMSFIAFDTPLQPDRIGFNFARRHNFQSKNIEGWTTAATKQQLIATYWLRDVPRHFSFVCGFPGLILFLLTGFADPTHTLINLFLFGLLSFSVLYNQLYRPYFSLFFLPLLESHTETFEEKETAKLDICRRAQLRNLSLVLIYYVLDKTSRIGAMQCNKTFAMQLTKLYGIDDGSIKDYIEIIFFKNDKITKRMITEIQNRIEDACVYFEEMTFPAGISLLRDLEYKLMQRAEIKPARKSTAKT